MSKPCAPSVELLRQLLSYDRETGRLTWRPRSVAHYAHLPEHKREGARRQFNAVFAGIEAFTAQTDRGYKIGAVAGYRTSAHRVALAMSTGAWPTADVDHIDGDTANNSASNLREVSHAVNGRNCALARNNATGVAGVRQAPSGKWIAKIGVDGREIALGTFTTFQEAVEVRRSAERRYGYHANAGRERRIHDIRPRRMRQGAKLTPEMVAAIRESSDRTCILAQRYGVHRSTIQIARRAGEGGRG